MASLLDQTLFNFELIIFPHLLQRFITTLHQRDPNCVVFFLPNDSFKTDHVTVTQLDK